MIGLSDHGDFSHYGNKTGLFQRSSQTNALK